MDAAVGRLDEDIRPIDDLRSTGAYRRDVAANLLRRFWARAPPSNDSPVTDVVIRGLRVLTPEGVHAAAIHVVEGRIARVSAFDDVPSSANMVEAGEALVFPGLVDTHVHVNEPGRTEWEGFATATRAAAAGGVTTLLDMPLNSIPPTTDVAALEAKRAAARGRCAVDVGFLGGVVPGNAAELAPLHSAGVFGFKCFLCPSGVDEFPPMSPSRSARGRAVARGARRRCSWCTPSGPRRWSTPPGPREIGGPTPPGSPAARSPRRRMRCDS